MKKTREIKVPHIFILIGFLVLSYAYGIIQFKSNTLINNFDITFQMKRVVGLSNVLKAPINFEVFSQPINIFYGWLTLYPAYLFYSVTKNLVLAYNIYLYLLTFFTLVTSYASMYTIYKSKFISVLFSILYSFSMYRTLCLFYRGAMGEAIAIAILPLVFSAVYCIIIQGKDCWVKLGISFSLLFYTHVLSAFIAFAFIVVLYLLALFSKLDNKKNMTISFFKAGLNALLLSLPFLIPLVEQYIYQRVSTPAAFNLSQGSLTVGNMVIGSFKEDLASNSIGLLLLVLIILSVLFFKRFTTENKCIFILGILTFLSTSKLFPWQFFQETPVRIIQFPYRLTAMSTLFLCFTSSYLVNSFVKSEKRKGVVVITLVCTCVLLNIFSIMNSPFIDRRINEENVNTEVSNALNDDYKPIGYEKYKYLTDKQQISINGEIEESYRKVTPSMYELNISAESSDIITLPLYTYKGVNLKVNGKRVEIIKENSPMISFKAEQGENSIKVYYKYTLLAKLSVFIAFFWIMILCFVVSVDYKKRSH